MEYKELSETASTNSYAAEHDAEFSVTTLIYALRQTSGRGQRGNSWESAPGKNMTFSIVYRPTQLPARRQFLISEAVALGVADYLATRGIDAKVKWPNDIYVGDKKICGILIEHSVSGMDILRSILGVGLNVNQQEFVSDAPNPISMYQLTGREYNLQEELCAIGESIERALLRIESESGREGLHTEFKSGLWRGDGKLYRFRDVKRAESYKGRIHDVAESGMLTIATESGELREYAFKEVEFVI